MCVWKSAWSGAVQNYCQEAASPLWEYMICIFENDVTGKTPTGADTLKLTPCVYMNCFQLQSSKLKAGCRNFQAARGQLPRTQLHMPHKLIVGPVC